MALMVEVGTIAVTIGPKGNVAFDAQVVVRDEHGLEVLSKADHFARPDAPDLQAKAQAHFVATATSLLAGANADRAAADKYAGLRAAIKTALEAK